MGFSEQNQRRLRGSFARGLLLVIAAMMAWDAQAVWQGVCGCVDGGKRLCVEPGACLWAVVGGPGGCYKGS